VKAIPSIQFTVTMFILRDTSWLSPAPAAAGESGPEETNGRDHGDERAK
jgi:hypothetical protein